ncbi:capsule biosynthesis protein [Roseovarius autotrophicus]|uniref:capsule biosynthesis protein n=1 Tax=Roseovarius autotrophicus TaxID=2824121 RepID=UPI001A0C33DB|nr:capsule biosynthesis protein [Roseovarius autotrophicus]MBE0453630.1 capsule biosynthesis protein [Roseovarius sp.]
MTTKPKVSKFRIRRSASMAGAAAQAASCTRDEAPREGQIDAVRADVPGASIDDIRREGLTGRELRLARRAAQKHGLAPTSDFDAVRLLRARGIDPFQRSGILELVAGNEAADWQQAAPRVQLPQTVPAQAHNLPVRDISPSERRASEIVAIQRDISRRRRRKLALLMSRLLAFVILPTFLAGYYFSSMATPMYASNSAFLILSADSGGAGGRGGLGGLLPSQFATGQDAIATQEYLESKDAMLRLDEEQGFRAHFSAPGIDVIQRLDPNASNEAVYKLYRRHVKIGYDPTEGVMRMEVIAADPETSLRFNQQLIAYAEERVDELSRDKRNDAVKIAAESLEQAKAERRAAQERLVALQEGTILDPEGEIAGIRSLINSVELQLQEKELVLSIQLNNARPNTARVTALQSEITVLRAELERQKRRLTEATEGDSSLASKTAAIQMAQADLATADMVLQSALESMRMSETEANKQVRYLTVSARPVPPQEASYPKVFENTVLAFLIFSGIYLMVSLTASILREQVTS